MKTAHNPIIITRNAVAELGYNIMVTPNITLIIPSKSFDFQLAKLLLYFKAYALTIIPPKKIAIAKYIARAAIVRPGNAMVIIPKPIIKSPFKDDRLHFPKRLIFIVNV
jgi:hypothetical protein